MSNFINPSVLAAEALDQLDYELVAGSLVYRDRGADFGTSRGLKVGDTVTIRTVSDFETVEFSGTSPSEEINQSSVQLQIEKFFTVGVEVTSKERALNLDGIRKEVVNPVMSSMAQKVDEYLLTKIIQSQGLYASTSLLSDAADIALARQRANLQQIAKTNRIGLVNDSLEAQLLGQDVFHKFDTRGEPAITALQEASMGRLMGIDWFSSVNMPSATQTLGTATGMTLDNGGGANNLQGVTTLTYAGGSAAPINAGDKLRIAGAKRDFTVAVTVADASAGTTVTLEEQINENLQALDGNAITIVGDALGASVDYQGIIFNPMAYGFAAPPLDPVNSELSSTASANGMSIRVTESYDRSSKKTYWDFDMIIGGRCIDPRKSMLLGAVS